MTSSTSGSPVTVGVDGSGDALRATRWAAKEAARAHAPLLLIHALGMPDSYTGAFEVADAPQTTARRTGAGLLRTATEVAQRAADVTVDARGEE